MKRIFPLIIALALMLGLSNCATVGNGKLDGVEPVMIKAAVNELMNQRPQVTMPAYIVSGALLEAKEGNLGQILAVADIQPRIDSEVAKLNLDPTTIGYFGELVTGVREALVAELDARNIPSDERLVMVWQVIRIVRDVAQARLELKG